MLIRDLILPDGNVMEFATGNVVQRETRPTDITWDELSGSGLFVRSLFNAQPFIGCQTGGDLVAEHLMNSLTKP